MLIIEIRDNTLRIIQATSKPKHFRITDSKTIEFEDTWKTYISDPVQATSLSQTLKSYKENKFLLCLNNSNVIYRDMVVPKASPRYLTSMIRHELTHALNLSNDYLMDYTILSDTISNGKKMHKILVATILASNLNEIVEFFDKIGMQISKVDVSLNSLMKYIDITKIASKEKNTLVTDISSASIRQYLFEKGKYSYYRTTKIAAFEESQEQLSLESTTETIEKMLQFSLSLGQNSGIDQIYLFGSYPKIEHLKIYMNDTLNVDTQIMARPKMLKDRKHKPFNHDSVYALGLLFSQRFKRKKDINLMTPYNVFYSRSSNAINFDAIFNTLAFGFGYLALFAVIITTLQTNAVNANIKKINDYLNRPDIIQALNEISEMKANIAALNEISKELDSIQLVLDSIPRYTDLKIQDFALIKPTGISLTKIAFTDNIITISISADDPSLIYEYVLELSELETFSEVTYTSYQMDTNSKKYTSDLHLTLSEETNNENN